MGISLISSGLKRGFHLESESGHLNVVRDYKGCCFKGKLQQLKKEQEGVRAATKLFKAHIPMLQDSSETASLYTSVNSRYRQVRSLTSGLWGWIRSLFRSREHNQQLRRLQKKYLKLRDVFPKRMLIASTISKVFLSEDSKSEAQTLIQLQHKMPELFKQGKIAKKDLNNSSFSIQRETAGYPVVTPSKAREFDSLSDVKPLKQPLTDFDSELKKLAQVHNITVKQKKSGGILINVANPDMLITEALLKLEEKYPFKIALTLDTKCVTDALTNFYRVHGQKVTRLNLNNVVGNNEEDDNQALDAWLPPTATRSLEVITITDNELEKITISEKLSELCKVNFYCEKLEMLKMQNLKNLKEFKLSHPEKIIYLKLTNCQKLSIPKDFSQFTELLALFLQGCSLKNLHLGSLSKLKCVDVSNTSLEVLPDLTNLPNLESLNLINCHKIQNISLLNLIAKLSINSEGCKNLKEISLDNCNDVKLQPFYQKNIRNGGRWNRYPTLNHSQFQSLEKLTLRNMKELTVINFSRFENLKNVHISNLNHLKELNLSGLKLNNLHLSNSPLLGLNLSHCQFSDTCLSSLVKQISQWIELRSLNLADCQLTNKEFEILAPSFKALRFLTDINITENGITRIPEAFNNQPFLQDTVANTLTRSAGYQVGLNSGTTHLISNSRDDLENNFFQLLKQLSSGLSETTSDLQLSSPQESETDPMELSKNFIQELFTVLAAKCLQEGMPNLEKTLSSFKIDEAKKLFHSVGVILAFGLQTKGRYPIGNVFSSEVFESLKKCSPSSLNKPYERLSIEELLSLSSESFKESLSLVEISNFLSAITQEESLDFMEAVNRFYTLMGKNKTELSDFERLKKQTQNLLFEHCKNRFWPIHAIAKGFSTIPPVWKALPNLKVKFLEQVIQGI